MKPHWHLILGLIFGAAAATVTNTLLDSRYQFYPATQWGMTYRFDRWTGKTWINQRGIWQELREANAFDPDKYLAGWHEENAPKKEAPAGR